jgi:hypothetical protein
MRWKADCGVDVKPIRLFFIALALVAAVGLVSASAYAQQTQETVDPEVAEDVLSPEVLAQIAALLEEAAAGGDTAQLALGLEAIVTANPDVALMVADFASRNMPAGVESGSELSGAIAAAVAFGIVQAAPELAAEISETVEINQPEAVESIIGAIQEVLFTVAGGDEVVEGPVEEVLTAGDTAEPDSGDAASPTG